MMAAKGSGFLYARSEVQKLFDPLVVSWRWGDDSPRSTRFVDEHQHCGTRDPAAFLSVPAAITYMNEHDWPTVQAKCHEAVRLARRHIAALTGLQPIVPDGPQWFRQMAAVQLPGYEAGELGRRLREEYSIVVPVFEWPGPLFDAEIDPGLQRRARRDHAHRRALGAAPAGLGS
jgi:isopenicillin-N epimerase